MNQRKIKLHEKHVSASVLQNHHHPEQQLGQVTVETETLSIEPSTCEDLGGDQLQEDAHSVQVPQVQC